MLRKGETLSALARIYGSRAQDIAAANGLSLKKRLARGTELIIPVPPRAAARPTPAGSVRTATSVGPAAPRVASDRVRVNYRVKSGDTLTRIAARFGTTVVNIMNWNKGVRPSRLAAGDLLTVYAHRND